ncbi:hypothetical protein C8J56DRAFT_889723 [Mycena floridula]|nr:hypothetical protein C8J56DRAFT_889723 [Mycena floridula]
MTYSLLSLAFILSVLLAQVLAAPVKGSCRGLKCPGTLAVLVCGIATVVLVPLGIFVLLRIRNRTKETDMKDAEQRLADAEQAQAIEQPGWIFLPVAHPRPPVVPQRGISASDAEKGISASWAAKGISASFAANGTALIYSWPAKSNSVRNIPPRHLSLTQNSVSAARSQSTVGHSNMKWSAKQVSNNANAHKWQFLDMSPFRDEKV